MDSHPESVITPPLPADVADALHAIWQGATADSVESETLEIKEDPAHLNHGEGIGGNAQAKLVEKLIDEAICLANGDSAMGHIVVGISDKTGGPSGFTGTDLDTDFIERKIFGGTRPNLRVEASDVNYRGIRLLVIRIPEALSLYTRTLGQARKRRGSECTPLSEEERRAIAQERANPDYSNGASASSVDDIEIAVIGETRRLLRTKRNLVDGSDYVPSTTVGLLRELGLLSRDETTLKRAADILLLPVDRPEVMVRHLWRPMVGADPQVTEIRDPLIVALPRLRRLIEERASQEIERVQFSDGQEEAIPRFPAQAIDEAVTNAFIHRDWQLSRPVVVDQSPSTLKIWSPGPLPPGVDKDHLLTTQSVPRNSRLMAAMRGLGLAEESSRGFDRMWSAMISSGREIPVVRTEDSFVEVVLSAGTPDTEFVTMLHELSKSSSSYVLESVDTLIVLKHLWDAPRVTSAQVEKLTQTSSVETAELMVALQEAGVVKRLPNSSEWVLGPAVDARAGKSRSGSDAVLPAKEVLRRKFASGESVYAAEAAEVLGISRSEVTAILRSLRNDGVAQIDPEGPQRGPRTRWIKLGGKTGRS
ncbi:RNA-binding domain-containing protein [Corynebacterium sp.]|uniref:RNA-binding domain-containing protein n=1 Tax=Corynebacterium sp. TaxID=1720 RepID=UPI002A916BAD|nr:RNA-binding domain-containing protein [Corynebacterium sp.]MDY5784670.1 ATP-binding protein [Corynebacterium sp.]